MQDLAGFELFLRRQKGQKESTIKNNRKLVLRLLSQADPLTKEAVEDFVNNLIDEGKVISYINQHILIVRFWGEYLNNELRDYPYCKLREKKRYIPATFSDDEVEAFINISNPFNKTTQYPYWLRHEMWSVFWAVTAYHGCRPCEAIKLRRFPTGREISHVDFGRNMLTFDAKSGPREVPLSFVVQPRIKNYVENLLQGDYLFPPLHSNASYMSEGAWGQEFKQRLKRLDELFPNISKRLNIRAYSLRHSAATRWVEGDWSLSAIQSAMGHSKLTTTQKYIHLSKKKVAEMINNDRLAYKYKNGSDLVKHYLKILSEIDEKFGDKVSKSIERDLSGKRVKITLDILD